MTTMEHSADATRASAVATTIDDEGATKNAGATAGADGGEHVADEKGGVEAAHSKPGTFKAAGSAKWKALEAGVVKAVTGLEVAFRDLTARTATAFSRLMKSEGK